jgi:hypothetical protein
MSNELVLGVIGTVTGIVGTVTGLANLILKRVHEKPRLKITDVMVSLQEKKDGMSANVSFVIDNAGDRATTIIRKNVILGPDVEVIEELESISANSSLRVPEKPDSSIGFSFPYNVAFPDGTRRKYFEKQEKLAIIVFHTHGKAEKTYELPPSSEWKKQALFKDGPTVLILG